MNREEIIALHDALVEEYSGVEDLTQEESDTLLEKIAILEAHLFVTGESPKEIP